MEYKHFSHQHPLFLHKLQPGQQFQCHGCHLPCHDSIFACWSCNFFIHEHCGNASRYVKHPSHPPHPLMLVPTPTYCSGSFICNACGAPGNSFSYCCAVCEVDLHVYCAFLPQKVSSRSHHHEIYLSLATPENTYCKICRKEISSKNWSYLCDKPECRDFRVHTFCATSEVQLGLYQDDVIQPDANHDQVVGGPSYNNDHSNTNMHQPQVRTDEMSPEEMILEIGRMRMEFEMAQALANMIAYS